MSRRLFYLNAVLLIGIILASVELRSRWLDARNREEMMRLGKLAALKWTPKPPIPITKPVSAVEYALITNQMLFSRDRNPTVIVEPPPPVVEKPWPALPKSYGLMLLGQPRIILGMNNSQKSYTAGEKIGEIEIVRFDNQTITFAWNNKTVEKRLDDLVDKNPMMSQAPAPVAAPAAPSAAGKPGLQTIGGSGADAKIGADTGLQGTKSCAAGDTSPNGTVLNGYKKVVVQGMFGSSCYWEPVK